MDLSFSRFDTHTEVTVLPADLAVLMMGVTARQAASPTAAVAAMASALAPPDRLFAPLHGAFNGPMAAQIRCWKDE